MLINNASWALKDRSGGLVGRIGTKVGIRKAFARSWDGGIGLVVARSAHSFLCPLSHSLKLGALARS